MNKNKRWPRAAGKSMLNLTAMACLLVSVMTAQADYLDPQLRAAVETLKIQVRETPTNQDNYSSRAQIAWDWLNAYARDGRYVPVNATTSVRPKLADPARPAQTAALDFYIRELTLGDEDPGALGELTGNTGPFEARTFATLRQTWIVGSKPVQTGGGLLIARHFMPGYGAFQVNRPAENNFVTISSSNPDVSFVPDQRPMGGMHGGFRGAQPSLFFRVDRGRLNSGDTVTVTYGDTDGGGRGLRMGAPSTDFLPLPIYVDFDGGGHLTSLPIVPFRVAGKSIDGVHVFAPSVVRPGQLIDISVRARDAYYNRATGNVPGFVVRANGEVIGTTESGENAITVIDDVLLSPGVHHLTVNSVDGTITGRGNPVLVSAEASPVYWGDTHGHSGFAEGIGTPDRFMRWAKEDARLDFVMHSEHDIWMDDREWQVLTDKVNEYSEEGRFIGYLGYEWTQQNRYGGHHNVLFRDTKERVRVPVQDYPTISRLYAGLKSTYDFNDVLVIPHAHQSGDYRQSDPDLQDLVEIMSQHGTFEWFGRAYVRQGHQVGFIAASDNHLSQPGYTSTWAGFMSQRGGLAGVMAERLERDALFDAMKNIQTYATTGDRIILDVRLNGHMMGQRTPFTTERTITGRVIGTAPIDSITLIKNDVEIWEQQYRLIEDGRFGKSETIQISFESDSAPMHPQDNARGSRGWLGKLTVTGADIESFKATDFFNPEVNELRRDNDNPNTLHFVTGSRGDASSIVLDLANISRSARITFELKAAAERGSPTRFRRPAITEPASVTLNLKDMERGELTHGFPLDIYNDTITLRRVITEGERDIRFEIVDSGDLQGDYYFVRVRQANDAMAWSSPIWVGGFAPR
ncbi:MAG: DUF3604 domain-containing protein [Gammaproteobacteria bacterium TMED50]|nr:MAG: DUF3604 domain-containing protein [Gammaproteobacteria bacterium TMED50]